MIFIKYFTPEYRFFSGPILPFVGGLLVGGLFSPKGNNGPSFFPSSNNAPQPYQTNINYPPYIQSFPYPYQPNPNLNQPYFAVPPYIPYGENTSINMINDPTIYNIDPIQKY